MAQAKTYVLLERMDSNAPIFNQIAGGKRVQIKKRPNYRLFNQITFADEEGDNKTIRYMNIAKNIFQEDQIKSGLLANAKYSSTDFTDLDFKHGSLTTSKNLLISYLDNYPGNENFKGKCDAIHAPIYKELDLSKENKQLNNDFLLRLKAANKIAEMRGDAEALSTLLIRLNGSFFATPSDPVELLKMAVAFLDDAEEEGLNLILKEDDNLNVDETTTILIGKLLNAGLLSFDKVEGKISKMGKDGKWIEVRSMSNEYDMDEKKRLFSDFLNTDEGKTLKNDLEKDLKGIAKVDKKK